MSLVHKAALKKIQKGPSDEFKFRLGAVITRQQQFIKYVLQSFSKLFTKEIHNTDTFVRYSDKTLRCYNSYDSIFFNQCTFLCIFLLQR